MAVALDAVPAIGGYFSSTAENTATLSFTIGSSANALLAVMLIQAGAANITAPAMTWNAQSLTSVGSIALVASSQILYLYGGIGTTITGNTGAQNLVGSFTGTAGTMYMTAISFTGALQTSVATTFTNVATGGPTSNLGTLAVTTAAGNMAVTASANVNGGGWAASAGSPNTTTEFWNQQTDAPNSQAQYSTIASGTSQTFNSSATGVNVWIGANVVAGAAAAAAPDAFASSIFRLQYPPWR